MFKYSYFARIVKEWNILPNHVRTAENVNCFKSMVIQFLNKERFNSLSHYLVLFIIAFRNYPPNDVQDAIWMFPSLLK